MGNTRSFNDFHADAVRDPYKVDMGDGLTVEFAHPDTLPTERAFGIYGSDDPQHVLQLWLGEDQFDDFWKVARHAPAGQTGALVDAVRKYFKRPLGEGPASPR